MIEAIAESDDHLFAKFIEGQPITEEEIMEGIRKATITQKIFPVICGSAFKNKGVQNLLDAVVDYLPSPLDIPPVQGVRLDNPENREERTPADNAPFSALVFKIMTDPFVGQLAFIRVYSGRLAAGESMYNVAKDRRERVGRLVKMHANKREDIQEILAGDICAAVVEERLTGDTICDEKKPVLLENIVFPAPVIQLAIEPKTKADQEKLGMAIQKLVQEDPTLRVSTDPETGQTILAGMGELHLEIIVDRMQREFNVGANVGKPQVAYRETIRAKAEYDYTHKKQTGGSGQCARQAARRAGSQAKQFEFDNDIKGGTCRRNSFRLSRRACARRSKAAFWPGYPMVDIKVDGLRRRLSRCRFVGNGVQDLQLHLFQGSGEEAKPVLLEPVMRVEVTVPEEYMGPSTGI